MFNKILFGTSLLLSGVITASAFAVQHTKIWGNQPVLKHGGLVVGNENRQTNSRQNRVAYNVHNLFDKMFEEEGPLGKGITVGKVQVAVMSNDRSSNSIFGLLDQAAMSSDDSSEGLAETCHEICMSLLRKQDDWIAASSDSRWFSANDAGKAESQYNEWSIQEASKFEKVRQLLL